MYPRLRERAKISEIYERDPVRFEVLLYLVHLSLRAVATFQSSSETNRETTINRLLSRRAGSIVPSTSCG
jgi:hypothetical protein